MGNNIDLFKRHILLFKINSQGIRQKLKRYVFRFDVGNICMLPIFYMLLLCFQISRCSSCNVEPHDTSDWTDPEVSSGYTTGIWLQTQLRSNWWYEMAENAFGIPEAVVAVVSVLFHVLCLSFVFHKAFDASCIKEVTSGLHHYTCMLSLSRSLEC